MDHREVVSNQHSAVSQNQQQNQKRFTTESTEKAEEQDRVRRRAEALVRRIGETCDDLDKLAEENPELVGRVTHGAEEHKDAYARLKARLSPQPTQNRRGPGTPALELADAAPRCRWVRTDGTSCGSPQMKKHIYCFAHRQMMEARALALSLPALEDANAIMVGIMRIQKALIDDTISVKKAGLLLYSMQLALQNVGQVTFGQVKTEELIRETVDEVEALSSQHSAFSQNQQQNQDQTPATETPRPGEEENLPQINADKRRSEEEERHGLPLMGTDDADKEPGLAGMTVDNRGLEKMRKPVEWRPPAEVFRMDTRKGMEAYEASFRMKIGTSGDLVTGRSGDRTGGALQKLDIAQTCANLE